MAAVAVLSRAEAALRRIAADLRELGRRFALVGGLAVSARTEPRLTRGADLAVLVADDRDAEALGRDLQARGWRARVRQPARSVTSSGGSSPPRGRVSFALAMEITDATDRYRDRVD